MASLIILAVIIAAAQTSKHIQSKSEKRDKLSLAAKANKSTYDLGPVEQNMHANMYWDSVHPPRYSSDDVASEYKYSLPAYQQIGNYHPAKFEVVKTENIVAGGNNKLTPTSKRDALRQKFGHWRNKSGAHEQIL